ncbi:MAG: type I pullulanase [Treponema sp.]|nr:type I pullulanase [Treponema sp.]
MYIKLQKNSKRRLAYTDRKDGYFHYFCGEENPVNGYHRGNVTYFRGITCQEKSLDQATSIEVYPEGFRAYFEKTSIDFSLLIDEQALFISAAKGIGLTGLNRLKVTEKHEKVEDSETENSWETVFVEEIQKVGNWEEAEIDGVHLISSKLGIAIASSHEFYHSQDDDDIEIFLANGNRFEISPEPFKSEGWYVTFEESAEEAIKKAVRLVKNNAIEAHKTVIRDFLSSCHFDSGNRTFNESFQWARFNAWLLATKDHGSNYRGIWAGLPWFRDNWGRDTFIALCGTLLVSGCFEEAKDVLLGFADFQDVNSKSVSYGRIPNRYRDNTDVIYNTADGTLWFIRALWEYIQYSGDTDILNRLKDNVEIALDADIKRCDENGLLLHADADTWMDARISGNEPLSPRGSRANDIQVLWYTALRIGEKIEKLRQNEQLEKKYADMAEKVKTSFERLFWNTDCSALADHLPEGGYGEWAKDMSVRPNQLFTISVPTILGKENDFISKEIAKKILENVDRELVSPFGLFSLSPEDPLFHPEHENDYWYHKDAAYHNGTIWEWNAGPYFTASALLSSGNMPEKASALIQNEAKMIMEYGCCGSLSENIHARPDSDGNPILSGTFSQAWSIAEYVRCLAQDFAGFKPNLINNEIYFNPKLPAGQNELSVEFPFGSGWTFSAKIQRKGKKLKSLVCWKTASEQKVTSQLSINGLPLEANHPIEITSDVTAAKATLCEASELAVPKNWITKPFASHNLNNEFCGAEHQEDYLCNLIKSGRMESKTSGGKYTAALEWYFDSEYFKRKYYTNCELGALYSERSTTFRLWAPTAKKVSLLLFKSGHKGDAFKEIPMELTGRLEAPGVWETEQKGDLDGIYYLFKVLVHGVEQLSADPYAKACGVNGKRSMVVNLKRTNPRGWEKVNAPVIKSPSDVIAYEAHIADITSSPDWNGPDNFRRTFLGACTSGTTINGKPTGFDYIKSLGVTHVQLLPVFDFRSVEEDKVNNDDYKNKITFGNFNWGYDPENYACLEGSYSTDPYNGAVRIKEFKQMVKTYNEAGIGIIMDVVYNHVNDGIHHALGNSVPGYFYRVEGYSGAGEDTASERCMFSKYMVDTLCFWLKEYKLSGFRFDLMGLHDVETMNYIRNELVKIKADVLIYGEGWAMYNAGKMISADQRNSHKMPNIGLFNDAFRCGIKGPVFDDKQNGFIQDGSRREAVKFGLTGAVDHKQIDFSKVEGTAAPKPWSLKTWVSVNYTEIHDNMTCYDKLFMTMQDKPEEYLDNMQRMALSLLLLSQGYPIMHAGMEFCRTKEIPQDILDQNPVIYDVAKSDDGKRSFCRNTYNLCDRINRMDWKRTIQKESVLSYVKKLIELRKAHPAFRLSTKHQCEDLLEFLDNKKLGISEKALVWTLDGSKCGDSWKKILIAANPEEEDISITLEGKGDWQLVADGSEFFSLDKQPVLGDGSTVDIRAKSVTIYCLS